MVVLMIDQTQKMVEAQNQPPPTNESGTLAELVQHGKSAFGKLKNAVADQLIDWDARRSEAGKYADQILDELENPQTTRSIQALARHKLQEIAATTMASVDRTPLQAIQTRHSCWDQHSCQKVISAKLNETSSETQLNSLLIVALFFGFLLTAEITRDTLRSHDVALLITGAALLLVGGVLNPMINIEARLHQLSFTLLGEPMAFTDQVLFFQSKSIWDVAHLLTTSGAIDMIVVGIFIALFSIGFPTLKLLASWICYQNRYSLPTSPPSTQPTGERTPSLAEMGRKKLTGWSGQNLILLFAQKTGKWSMADVFVVAIFMAYIAFGGLIEGQLSQIQTIGSLHASPEPRSASLQAGFYLFLGFCVASIHISSIIDRLVTRSISDQKSLTDDL